MPPRKKKANATAAGITVQDVASSDRPAAVTALAKSIEDQGGAALSAYRDPYGGHWLVLAALPIGIVEPTPFQRELSDAHAKRLEAVIPKVGRFLDPLVAVAHDGGFWTPNGMHRLEAMKRLGASSIVALVVPEKEIAYRILALNTEKAHNLKDQSLEVVRRADALAEEKETASMPENTWEFEFEEPGLLTIGRCYQAKPRFSGGAYMPVVRRADEFQTTALAKANKFRAERAESLLALDKEVDRCVKELKEAGFTSGYLKPFVVARLNPLRFSRGKPGAVADFDDTIAKMMDKAAKFDAGKVKPADLAASAGAGGSGE
jgi:ParB family chromosome partitioning protein